MCHESSGYALTKTIGIGKGSVSLQEAWFHDALDEEFSFTSPRAPGYDTVGAIRAMRDGNAKVFVCMGGNFARATPAPASPRRPSATRG